MPREQLDNLDDTTLARRAQSGCVSSFEELIRRFQVPLMKFLTRRLGDRRHDAEDILQETFVRAYRKLHLYNPRYPVRSWLYTIACHTAARHRRMDAADVQNAAELSRPQPAVLQEMVREEERGRLWNLARRQLSDEQFSALYLFHVEQFSTGDIARVLDRSWVSVKTMLHRARKRLAAAVAAMESSDRPNRSLAAPLAGRVSVSLRTETTP